MRKTGTQKISNLHNVSELVSGRPRARTRAGRLEVTVIVYFSARAMV